jgi:hypothetical protein
VAVLLALTGCTKQTPAAASAPSLPPSISSSAAAATSNPANPLNRPMSSRGNMIKKLGEEAGICGDDSCKSVAVRFSVDEVKVDAACTEQFAGPASNGHMIAVKLRISTASDMRPEVGMDLFNPNDFAIIGPDELTESSLATQAAYSCLNDREKLPTAGLAPGSKYQATIVLDSRNTGGALQFRPSGSTVGLGWEWQF